MAEYQGSGGCVIAISTGYWVDCYNANDLLLARFAMTGVLGKFTGGTLHAVSREGVCVKIGLWGTIRAEVYRPALGSGLEGNFSVAMMKYNAVALGATSLAFINTYLCEAAGGNAMTTESRSNGCWCGAWLGGGIHEDWCAPGLAGKSCLPAE